MYMTAKTIVCVMALWVMSMPMFAQSRKNAEIRRQDAEFFKTEEARRIGDQILMYQRCTGGWPKNVDMARPLSDEEIAQVKADKARRDDSTTDNNATNIQIEYLARLYKQTGDKRYSNACANGIEYLLNGQYENGGWPQFWPEMRGYQTHITYNDNAMVNTLRVLQMIINNEEPYDGNLIGKKLHKRIMKAFNKGIDCILATQIAADGELTVWCQQHDRETLKPAPARAYELPSYCSQESVNIVKLLMSLPNPDDRIRRSVEGAMRWFEKYKIVGKRVTGDWVNGQRINTRLIDDPNSIIWARYYDLENCEPYVCDRDGVPRKNLEDIGQERRNGYSWYGDYAIDLFPLYEEWKAAILR